MPLLTVVRSFRKSSKLAKLQRKIHPPGGSTRDLAASLHDQVVSGKSSIREQALSEYLDLCESDPGVQEVMRMYELSRDDLKGIYVQALAGGLGQWVKGHFAALSTIA